MNMATEQTPMNELFDIAVLAYRGAKYEDAIQLLQHIVDVEKQNWLAWFYLGMSYLKSGDNKHAYKVMRVMSAMCPIQQLRDMAASILPSTQEQLSPAAEPGYYNLMTGTGG